MSLAARTATEALKGNRQASKGCLDETDVEGLIQKALNLSAAEEALKAGRVPSGPYLMAALLSHDKKRFHALELGDDEIRPHVMRHITDGLMVSWAWRESKAVYVFDDDIARALADPTIKAPIKTLDETFTRTPHKTQYICLRSLKLEIEFPNGGNERIVDPTIRGVFATQTVSLEGTPSLMLTFVVGEQTLLSVTLPFDTDLDSELSPVYAALVRQVLPLVLYLCSDRADLRKRPTPQAGGTKKRKKRKKRNLPPRRPVVYEAAFRLGASYREQHKQASLGGTVRPHVRRAHWHTYWTGPRKIASERKRLVKWLPPTIVAGTVEDIATTRYHVKKKE